ncbi:MAG: 7-cyano-7-deazaguanine synthase QueC [Candidatus Omnitrophota bacterium]
MRSDVRTSRRKAVVLLSGGLDSATTLFFAKSRGYECFCLAFNYGQRHDKEINAAKKIAESAKAKYRVLKISLPWKGSALLDNKIAIPKEPGKGIPSTYVPARNIIFLSFALSYAEAIGAAAIFIGAHAQDYSGYPDCRPEFFSAFNQVARSGTKAGSNGKRIEIKMPLINKTKAEIIKLGARLGVPFRLTWSCYTGERKPCGECDSCFFRHKGFQEAGFNDPWHLV